MANITSQYGFIITKVVAYKDSIVDALEGSYIVAYKDSTDNVTNPEEQEGRIAPIVGPINISPAIIRALANGEGIRFRMLCNDRHIMYEGRIITGEYSDNGKSILSKPLNDFGRKTGATIIQYTIGISNGWKDL